MRAFSGISTRLRCRVSTSISWDTTRVSSTKVCLTKRKKKRAREKERDGEVTRVEKTERAEEKIEEESYKSVKEDSNTTAYPLGNRPDATITVPTGENNFCYDFCRTKTIVLRSNNWRQAREKLSSYGHAFLGSVVRSSNPLASTVNERIIFLLPNSSSKSCGLTGSSRKEKFHRDEQFWSL